MFDMPSLAVLGLFFAVNVLAASSGAVFKPGDWYEGLRKPSWTPPDWAFPVVWSILFAMIAVAGWLVWEAAGWGAGLALGVYGVSLVINAAWSGLFFGLKRMDWALVDVIALWLSIVAVMAVFWPISPLAALLHLPYLAWVTLAGVLNLAMLRLNPRAGRARRLDASPDAA